ncbi:MAG: DUF5811 family protein [Haloarculaceae archaeon]
MYGNTELGGDEVDAESMTPEQRRRLKRDLARVAERTREFLPEEFIVGSELSAGATGPEATVAVRPPVGPVVSAGYTPEDAEAAIDEEERDDIAQGLAASAALQVKQAGQNVDQRTAR